MTHRLDSVGNWGFGFGCSPLPSCFLKHSGVSFVKFKE